MRGGHRQWPSRRLSGPTLGHAIAAYAQARAAVRRVRTALAAVARSEGGEDADPACWGALLTA
jgi:hypothetical protein